MKNTQFQYWSEYKQAGVALKAKKLILTFKLHMSISTLASNLGVNHRFFLVDLDMNE